ncbi:MAG: hypothetical protein Q8P41_14590 [Pseudomonadota bacterium]|nr:hypothetical protein [Pseudomonadota bacterium]
MMFGPARFDLAGEELLRIVQGELARAGQPSAPDDVAALFGLTPDELWWWLDQADRRWLDELIARWNAKADGHLYPRIVLIDHGDEVELLVGHIAPTA